MIESLDSLSLAAEIDRQARKHGIVMDVLVEINIGREKEKSGIMPEETEKFLRVVAEYPAIRVRGLMTVAPRCETVQERIKYFEETHKIFIDISKMELHNIDMSYLSMGMTQSYEEGILCGANIVRVGSGIFGERDYTQIEKSE
jgi:pyridoxal phosphate enzyme (YggS family)